jgi:hypothetical protein
MFASEAHGIPVNLDVCKIDFSKNLVSHRIINWPLVVTLPPFHVASINEFVGKQSRTVRKPNVLGRTLVIWVARLQRSLHKSFESAL